MVDSGIGGGGGGGAATRCERGPHLGSGEETLIVKEWYGEEAMRCKNV